MNGVIALMKAIYNDYAPTGAYSLEFVEKNGDDSIAEVFFAMPPEEYSVEESEHSDVVRTLSGGYYADHGVGFKKITFSGSLNFYTIMNPSLPVAANTFLASSTDGVIDGLTEFYKLRYLLMRYKDYTLTPGGKVIAPSFSGSALSGAAAVAGKVAELVESGEGALVDKVQLVWHSYDTDDHYFVKVDSLTSSQSSSDVNSIKYNCSLTGYQVDKRKTGGVRLGNLGVGEYKAPVEEQIRQVMNVINNTSTETRS